MRTIRLIAVSISIAALFAISAFAQATPGAPAASATSGKIGLINTFAFDDDKEGIKKYVNAMNSLEAEFKPRQTELQTMATKIENLIKDLQTMREQAEKNVPVDQKTFAAKQEEGEKLQREFKFKQDDAKAAYERRSAQVLGPIQQEIGKAITEFSKAKGFAIILDVAKLDQAGIVLALDDKMDVTKEFITFFNARPAGTATVAAPK